MTKLTIQTFGGLQIRSESGRRLAVPTRKAQALLVYLALHAGAAQPRLKLAALLWEDSGDAQARASLRQGLTTLRRAIALDDELVASGDAVVWPVEAADVDAVRFEQLIGRGGLEELDEAVSLYTGDFLEAFDAKSLAFQEWSVAERHRLRERALDAMSRLLTHLMVSQTTDRAIGLAVRLLALDPLQETVHRSLMELYVRQGREASALRQFQLCREILERELHTVPQPETEELYRQIRHRRRSRSTLSTAGPPLSETSEVDGNAGFVDERPPAMETEPTAEAHEPESEIRPVTVLACQLAEPAKADDEPDPEESRLLFERFQEVVTGVVLSYGGTVERHLGDAAIALFGTPIAHGNDAERAVRAGLQIREAVRFIGGEHGSAPAAEIGIADGPALVTRLLGPPVRPFPVGAGIAGLAWRLASAAAPDEILITEAAFRQLSHRMLDAKQRSLAGRTPDAPLTVWSIQDLGDSSTPRATFVGRGSEIAQFAAALRTCRECGRGQTIVIRGEAGIGKTRLVGEFSRLARDEGYATLTGFVLDFGVGKSEGALPAIVRDLLAIRPGSISAEQIDKAAAAGVIPAGREMHVYDLLQVDRPVEFRALFTALDESAREREAGATLQEIVRRASASRPRLFIIEDIHWADPTTLEMTAYIGAAVRDCAAILVLTTRSEGDPLTAARRSRFAPAMTIELGPLHFDEASRLAAGFAEGADAFALRCIERAGGNPLFLEQLLLGRSGLNNDVPASVRSVVLSRLDRLSPANRRALKAASVLGQHFSSASLTALLGDSTFNGTELVAEVLLTPERGDYRFSHALVQESVYASLPKSERRKLHLKASEWFGTRDLALRAEHLDRAEDTGATRAYLEAALSEAADYRYQRAIELIERGRAIAVGAADRFELTWQRGELLHDSGAVAEAAEAYEAALALANEDRDRARAWLGRAAVKRFTDDLAGAFADLERAEAAAERLDLAEVAARAHLLHGNLLFPRGDVSGCLREHQRSLDFALRSGSAALEAAAFGGIGDAEYMRGRMRTAHERFSRSVAIARDRGLGRIAVANQPMAAVTRIYCGDIRGALADALAAIDMAAKVGHRRAETIARHIAYLCHHSLADFDAAWREIEIAHALARELKAPRFEAEALGFRAELHRIAGRRSAALADIRAALAISREVGFAYIGPVFLGTLALSSEDAEIRAAAVAEGDQVLAGNEVGHNHFLFRRDAIEACLEAGDWNGVLRQAAALERFARPEPLPWTDLIVARGRALAAFGKGTRNEDLATELRCLIGNAETAGYLIGLTRMKSALTQLG